MRFCRHVPNSLRNNNIKSHIPNIPKEMVIMASKTLLSPLCIGEKKISSSLNVTINLKK